MMWTCYGTPLFTRIVDNISPMVMTILNTYWEIQVNGHKEMFIMQRIGWWELAPDADHVSYLLFLVSLNNLLDFDFAMVYGSVGIYRK
jgi:hypothetical protein